MLPIVCFAQSTIPNIASAKTACQVKLILFSRIPSYHTLAYGSRMIDGISREAAPLRYLSLHQTDLLVPAMSTSSQFSIININYIDQQHGTWSLGDFLVSLSTDKNRYSLAKRCRW